MCEYEGVGGRVSEDVCEAVQECKNRSAFVLLDDRNYSSAPSLLVAYVK